MSQFSSESIKHGTITYLDTLHLVLEIEQEVNLGLGRSGCHCTKKEIIHETFPAEKAQTALTTLVFVVSL